MTADNVYRTLNLTNDSYINEEHFRNVSVIVVAYLFSFSSVDSAASHITWHDLGIEDFQGILLHAPDVEEHEASECLDRNETICLSEGQLESMLRAISNEYVPGELKNYSSCEEEERVKERAVQDTLCTFGEMKVGSLVNYYDLNWLNKLKKEIKNGRKREGEGKGGGRDRRREKIERNKE